MAPNMNEKRSFSTAELTKLVHKANLHLLIHGKGKTLCCAVNVGTSIHKLTLASAV